MNPDGNYSQRNATLGSTRIALRFFLGGDNFVGPHHFVVFVLQDVAMPHVAPGESFEGNDDARNHSRIGAYRVFPAALGGRGGNRGPGEADRPLVLKFDMCRTAGGRVFEI